jgi:hypothetical protein
MIFYILILAPVGLFLLYRCYWFVVGFKARNVGIFGDDRCDNDQR